MGELCYSWATKGSNELTATVGEGVKEKDLIGGAWKLAFALRDDGWWLRDCIIWHKLNPTPKPVRDRTCPAHEYIFMLAKNSVYYYDNEAIEEPIADCSMRRYEAASLGLETGGKKQDIYERGISRVKKSRRLTDILKSLAMKGSEKRKKRSVWTVSVPGFGEAHFATFPPDLIKPCVLAGAPAGGSVLDPFGGAGTPGVVSRELDRHCTLIGLVLTTVRWPATV